MGTRRSNLRLDYLYEGGAADCPRLSTTTTRLDVVVLADVSQTTEGEGSFRAEAVVEGATHALSDDLGGEDEVRGWLVFEGSAVEVDDVCYAPEIALRAFGGELAFNKPVQRNVLRTGLVVNLAGEKVASVEL